MGVLVSVAVLMLAGCTSSKSPSHLRLQVSPATALFDTPVTVSLTGLKAGEKITLSTSSAARNGTAWSAKTTLTASKAGTVHTTPVGVFADEAPKNDPTLQQAFRPRSPWTITVTASEGGHRIASTTITRLLPAQVGVVGRPLRPATSNGLYAEYFAPRPVATRHPAVVVIGGSEGGLSTALSASELAAHGYPALALAYFKEPGLPSSLARIPIEYFAHAFAWLAKQRDVDPQRMTIWGTSRGSEAALLTAAHFPSLVRGAVVASPSDIAYESFPSPGEPAWTFRGRGVPTAGRGDFYSAVPANRAALIPVAPIRGPVFAVCGVADLLWPSCDHVDSIVHRLAAAHARYRPTALHFADAGHYVGDLLPFYPATVNSGPDGQSRGGTPAGNERGRATGFVALLHWLATLPTG